MDKNQTEKIFHDMVELPKEIFDNIRDMVFDKPYEWCFLSKTNNRIYKGFNELIIQNDDENDIEI